MCRPRYFCRVFPLSRFPVTQLLFSLYALNKQRIHTYMQNCAHPPEIQAIHDYSFIILSFSAFYSFHATAIVILSPCAGSHPTYQSLRDQRLLRILRCLSNTCKVTCNTVRTHLALNYSIMIRSLSASPLWRFAPFPPPKSRSFLVYRPDYFCGVFPLSRHAIVILSPFNQLPL